MPVTDSATWYQLAGGRRVAGQEARQLKAFLAAVPELRAYRVEEVVRVLDAARRVLAAADAQAGTPAVAATDPGRDWPGLAGLPFGAVRPPAACRPPQGGVCRRSPGRLIP